MSWLSLFRLGLRGYLGIDAILLLLLFVSDFLLQLLEELLVHLRVEFFERIINFDSVGATLWWPLYMRIRVRFLRICNLCFI